MTPEVKERIEQIRHGNVPEGYKRTRKGIIPNEWSVQQIRDFAVISSGSTPNRGNPAYWNGDIPWVTTGELEGGYIKSTNESITSQALSETSLRVYPAGTLLMAMYGQGKTRGTVAKLGIDATVNQACAAITVDAGVSEFIFYALQNAYNDIRKLSNTGNQENLNADIIKTFSLICPPIAEQQGIAEILTTQDKAIELKERRLVEKQRQKKYLMQMVFTQDITEKRKLSDISIITMGQSPSSASYNEEMKGIPLIQGNADIYNRKPHPRMYTTEPTKQCHEGDILLSVRAPVGTVAKSDIHACIGRGICAINAGELSDYVYQYLYYFEKRWGQVSQGSTFESISGDEISKLVIPVSEKYRQVTDVLKNIDHEVELLQRDLGEEKQKKKALMQLLLTGIVRVNI